MQAKYFRISALVLELRMLIFFRSEKIRVTESAIRLSGTLCCVVVWCTTHNKKNIISSSHFLFLLRTTTTSVLDYLCTVLYFNFYDFEGREEEKFKV